MGRSGQIESIDPSSGLPLPAGVVYRGPSQYRARKLVNGRRVTQTFTTAKKVARWLAEVEIDAARGRFVDMAEAQRHTLGQVIERYRDEILGEDSEKRGAEKEKGHLKIVLKDELCAIRMSLLSSADIAAFRDRMKAVDYAPATIVRRLNLVQTIIEHARREWRINIAANPAQLVERPVGADRKRDRMLAPANSNDEEASEDEVSRSEEERLLRVDRRPASDGARVPRLGYVAFRCHLSKRVPGIRAGAGWDLSDSVFSGAARLSNALLATLVVLAIGGVALALWARRYYLEAVADVGH
ncbi:MAG: recombinase [Rhodospirillales bacterium]|nr:recombinase [Rhodospirillales bacterium]